MERHYGVLLFDRLGQKLYLTPAGQRLLKRAQHLAAEFDEMELAMKNAGQLPLLRIGASVTVGTCLLNGWLDTLDRKAPATRTEVTVHNTTVIEAMVADSRLDVGVVEGEMSRENLVHRVIGGDELLLVCGKGHPLYGSGLHKAGAVDGLGLIAREEGSTGLAPFLTALAEKGASPRKIWSCSSTEAMKNAALSGRGAAILSRLMVERKLEEGSLWAVPVEGVKVLRQFRLIHHPDKFFFPGLLTFARACGLGREAGNKEIGQSTHNT